MAVTVQKLIDDFDLEVLVPGAEDNLIKVQDVNRPGLQLAGFYNYYDNERIQVIGNGEWSFLDELDPVLRKKRLQRYFRKAIPCMIITRRLQPHPELLDAAQKSRQWVLRTSMSSSRFISKITMYLANEMAPEVRMHGGLIDVHGIGVLITGDSGVGKSEATLELIRRGHRLISDDAVDIREVDGVLTGYCPEITFGMIEVRGMGIIDITQLYGLSSTSQEKNLDLIIHLQRWEGEEEGVYDRLGINEYQNILGVDVKRLNIPVRSGRNIAIIIEAAAANYRYSKTARLSPSQIIDQRFADIPEREHSSERKSK
ncbi:HPr kinase/phosphorylase [Clostridiaceae bacterium JG1575]|nr:HPr kinase/phosphorylase [Clostridiaceae bacterium JG1575]